MRPTWSDDPQRPDRLMAANHGVKKAGRSVEVNKGGPEMWSSAMSSSLGVLNSSDRVSE